MEDTTAPLAAGPQSWLLGQSPLIISMLILGPAILLTMSVLGFGTGGYSTRAADGDQSEKR